MAQPTSSSLQKQPDQSSKTQQPQKAAVGPGIDASAGAVAQKLPNGPYTPSDMLQLQRAIGNRAVAQMLQQGGHPQRGLVVQAKLTVGPANDHYEQEADNIAARVLRMPNTPPPSVQKQDEEAEGKGEQVQRAPLVSQIQRDAPVGLEGGPVSSDLERSIQGAARGGSALPSKIRSSLEPKLNADLSRVKIHTGSKSAQLNRDLGAKAFTHKNHIFYGAGQSPNDMKLTTHEAVHTIQQGAVTQRSVQRKDEEQADGVPGVTSALGAERVNRKGANVNTIQRAVGFEFQTTWGIVKNEADPTYVAPPQQPPQPQAPPQQPPPLTTKQKIAKGFKSVGKAIAKPFKAIGKAIGNKINPPQPQQPVPVVPAQRQGPIPPDPGRKHTRFPKAHNHIDDGYVKLSTDDASTTLGSEIEWVIDPPIPDNATPEELEAIVIKLMNYINQLRALSNEDSFRLSRITGKQSDDEVEIQPAAKSNNGRAMDVSAQTTGGIKYEHMFDMLKEIAGRQGSTSTFNSGTGSGRATQMTDRVEKVNIDGSPQLKGLLAFIVNYMSMNRSLGPNNDPYKFAADYAKVNTQFLLRTDFATMFNLLPYHEREKYAKKGSNNPDAFLNLVKSVMPDIDMNGQVFERGIKNTSNQTVKYFPLTRKEWIQGIAEGEDKLSGASDYAKQQGYAGDLESMGNINGKAGKLDKVGRDSPTGKTGIIMEFRSKTDQIKAEEIPHFIRDTFSYIQKLNARKTEQEKVQEKRLNDDTMKRRQMNFWG